MSEEITKSIKATLYERVGNPLLSSFCIAWAIWNYRFLMLIMSNLNVSEKFSAIDQLYHWWSWNLYDFNVSISKSFIITFLGPLVSSIAYIWILPIPTIFFYEIWYKNQITLLRIKQKIEDETPITQAEARKLRALNYELENYYENKIQEISERSNNKKNIDPFNKAPENLASYEVEIWNEEYELFKTFPEYKSFKDQIDDLFAKSKVGSSIINFGALSARGLVTLEDGKATLTEKGRYFGKRKFDDESKNFKLRTDRHYSQRVMSTIIKMIHELDSVTDSKDTFKIKFKTFEKYVETNRSQIEKYGTDSEFDFVTELNSKIDWIKPHVEQGNQGTISTWIHDLSEYTSKKIDNK